MRYENKTREELIKELKILRKKYEKNISECKDLKDSVEYSKILFDYAPDGYYINDLKGNFIDGNKVAEKITGYQKEELIGKSIFQLGIFSKKDIPKVQKAIKRNKKGLSTQPEEYTIHRKDKSEIAVEISTYPAKIKGKMVVLGIARDITKRKQVKMAFKKSEYGLAEAQRMAHIGSWNLDLFTNTLTWSDEVYRIFGLKPQQFKATYEAFLKNVHPDDREQVNQAYTESVEKKIPYNIVHRLVPKNGITKYVSEYCQTYYDDNGKPIRSIGTVQDITQRKQVEERIKHLNLVLRTISDVNQIIIKETDREKLIKSICHTFIQSRGYHSSWIILLDKEGKPGIYAEAGLGKAFLPLAKQLKKGHLTSCSQQVLTQKDIVYIKDPVSTCTDCPLSSQYSGRGATIIRLEHQGKIYGFMSVSAPVHFIKDKEEQALFKEAASDIAFALYSIELEEERKKAEEKYRSLFELSKDGIAFNDMEGNFLNANQAFLDMLGYRMDEISRLTYKKLIPKKWQNGIINNLEKIRTRGYSDEQELELTKKDRTIFPVSKRVWIIKNKQGKPAGMWAIIRDITESKKAEEALRTSRDYLEQLTDSMPDIIFSVKMPERTIEWVNDAFKQTGYDPKACIGKASEFLYAEKSEYIKNGKKIKETIAQGKNTFRSETLLKRKNGEIFPAEFTETYFVEKGKPTRITGILRDITERKKAEHQLKFLESAVESSMNGIALADLQGNLIYVNSSILKMWGNKKAEDILGQPVSNFFYQQEDAKRGLMDLINKEKWQGEIIASHKDGTLFDVQASTNIIKNKDDKPIGIIASFIDITEKKKTRKMIEERDSKIRALFNNSNYALGLSKNGIKVMVNPAYLKLFGYNSNVKSEGRPILEDIAPKKHAQIIKNINLRSKDEEAPSIYETLGIRQDGSVFDMEVNISTYKYNDEVYTVPFLKDITERKQAEERIKHLNLFLQAIRRVNVLIIKEKNREKLLKGACENLIETRGYYNAWIALLDEKGKLKTCAEAGLGKDFLPVIELLKRGKLTTCFQKALKQQEIVIIKDPASTCTECPLAQKYSGRAGFAIRLKHRRKVYGLLTVSISAHLTIDQEEQNLFKEVAEDIALGLHNIEQEENLEKRTHDLSERVKELNCLNKISDLVESPGISPEAIIKGTVHLLPPSWQYPRITCARIILDSKEYKSKNFKETAWKQASDIILHKKPIGTVEVYYLEERPQMDEGPFLKEERDLINIVAGRLGNLIEEKQAEEEQRVRAIMMNNLAEGVGITGVDDLRIKWTNKKFEIIFGYDPGEMIGKQVDIITAPTEKTPAETRRAMDDILIKTGEWHGEVKNIKRDGTHFWCQVNTSLFDHPEYGKVVVAALTDITQRKKAEERLQKAMNATIDTMSSMIEAKDPYTSGHQQRVSQLAVAIAKELDLSQDKVEGIKIASLIHDIGKIGIPTEILSKPTKLSDIEFSLIKEHSQIGYDILKSIDFPYPVAQIILQHHEKMDGSGYPNNLKGDEILLKARIIGVADVVEAMSSHRPYRPALGIDVALEEISQNKDILYDPEVVDVCLRLFKEKGFKFQ